MDPAALAGLCALLARGAPIAALPPGSSCAPLAIEAEARKPSSLSELIAAREARDAIARVAQAEAANQGDSGLAAVVYTILNRLQDGRWGRDVDAVLNARAQFEPVMRAGGDWKRLPTVSASFQARIDTILNLAIEGRLPDLTNGARFFQNARVVAARARAGHVSPALVDFGGAIPSAEIGGHRFYVDPDGERGGAKGTRAAQRWASEPPATDAIFVGDNLPDEPSEGADARAAATVPQGDPAHALFIGSDGRVTSPRP